MFLLIYLLYVLNNIYLHELRAIESLFVIGQERWISSSVGVNFGHIEGHTCSFIHTQLQECCMVIGFGVA